MEENMRNKRFTIYDCEEKTVLELVNKLGTTTNDIQDSLDNKTDLFGDHKGSWQGLNRPTMSEEGMRATVEDIIDNKIPSIETSLDNIESYIKPKGKLNGVCFYFGNDTLEQFKIDIKRCKDEICANSITLCVSVPYNFGTNNPEPVLIEWLDTLIPYCKELELIPIVRCHTSPFGLSEENKNIWYPTDVDLWFTNFRNVVMDLVTYCKKYGVEYFQLTNELPQITTKQELRPKMVSIIDDIRADYPTLKIGASMESQEWDSSFYWGLLDFYGHNAYIPLTESGFIEDKKKMYKSLYCDYKGNDWVKRLKDKKDLGYKVWITEIGCPAYLGALNRPANPNTDNVSNETQHTYARFIMDMVDNLECIDGLQLWCGNSISWYWTVLRNKTLTDIYKNKWGGNYDK